MRLPSPSREGNFFDKNLEISIIVRIFAASNMIDYAAECGE